MANPIITKIQIEGNDVVSFLNGTNYVRSMSQILPQNPTYISYRYDSITISQVAGEAFTFSIYTVTDVGGISFTELTIQDAADVVQARTVEIYRLLVTSIFKGCCECGNTEPECSIQYIYGEDASLLGTFKYTGSKIVFNYTTANNQDFTGFFPIIQDGSWVFLFSKTDPTIFAVLQLSNFVDGGIYAEFDAIELNAQGVPFVLNTQFCIDFTSVGGSLVQDWQDTLNISSLLTQDNTVDGGGFDFVFDNNNSFTINGPGGSVEVDVAGPSLNAGSQQILVTSGYIDIITPSYASASTGWVLALTAAGHVEYVEAGTGTISSIELIMPPAFTVSDPNPLTTDGTFTVTVDGTEDQYINGLGELADFPIYTVENGLHTKESPADPKVFHLGGTLIEDTTITVTNGASEWAFGVSGLAAQDTQVPFGVSNLGQAGVATFQDYAIGARTNPSVLIVGDNDTWRPLLDLELEGPLPNPGAPAVWENHNSFLRLKHTGDTEVGARMAIDYTFRNTSVSPNPDIYLWPAVKLIAEATNVTENSETSNFSIRMFDGGSQQDKMLIEGKGQLTLNEYGTGLFSDGTTNINNSLTYLLGTDNTGKVWKKLATAGGTVQSVSGTGLITTSPNPITTIGTVTTNMATNRLVGRYSPGSGIMQEITIGPGLSLSGSGELSADGSVPVYTVNNGLSPDPFDAYNFQLGGKLIQDTTINGQSSWQIYFNNVNGFYSYSVIDSSIYSTTNTSISSGASTSIGSDAGYSNYVPQAGPGATVNATHDMSAGYNYIRTRDTSGGGDTFNEIYMKSSNGGSRHMAFNSSTNGSAAGIFIGIASDFSSSIPTMKVSTPNVGNGSAVVGQVLTLKSMSGNDIGRVEFEDAGGGGTYDSDQGIYKDTSLANDTFMLGAPYGLASAIKFLEERQVDTDVYTLYIEGVISGGFVSVIQNNSDGNGLFVSAPQAYGLDALTDSGRAVNATANDAGSYAVFASNKIGTGTYTYSRDTYALNAVSQDGVPGKFEIGKNSLTASIFDVIQLRATNIDVTGGISIASQLNTIPVSNLITKWTTYNDVSQFEIQTKPSGGAISTNLVVKGTGQLQLNNYTTATSFDPESGPSIGVLNVDNAGNVFVGDGGGGSYTAINGITPVAPTPPSTTTTFKLGGLLTEDTNINGDVNQYSLGFDDMYTINATANFKTSFAVNDGTTTSNLALQAATTDIGCGVNGSGSASFAQFTDTQSRLGYLTATQTVQFGADATGLYVKTPDVASAAATVGQVLTLQNATTGEAEWADASGGGIPFGIASGTDTYAVSAGTASTYTDGDAYLVRFTNGNTGASTLNVNSIGAANMYSNSDGLLIGGDIWAGAQMLCIYNSSLPGFQCIGTSPNSLFAYVTNAETTAITKGMAVYAFGGTGDRMTVKKALATGDSTSAQTVGIVYSSSIGANQKGIIIVQGELVDLGLFPTSGGPENWSDGEPVYLSSATAGAVTRVKQYAPNHLVYLGICIKASNGTGGRMYVRIQNGFELDELHNVQAQTPADKDTLWYDNSVTPKQWKTASIPTILGYTPVATTRTISTTAPLAGGGDLSANRTLSIADAVADGATKGAAAFTATDFNSAAGVISIDYTNGQSASGSNKGFLTSADWTRFDSFKTQTISVTVDGSGGTITAGVKGYVRVPYACTITAWSILTGNAGAGATITFDIWRANNAIPTVANSLVGGGTKPFLTSNTSQITSGVTSTWTANTLAANDILAFNVEAGAAVFSWANLQLTITRT